MMDLSSPKEERYDTYWQATESSYPHYPTIRHRKRFIMKAIEKFGRKPGLSVFDFGCGEATLLREIQKRFSIAPEHIGGCDISPVAVQRAQEKIESPWLFHADFPDTTQTFDIIICSEVLEHTTEYEKILRWMYEHLSPGGLLILTTQTGKIHASDRYTGHTQHFDRKKLTQLVRDCGYTIQLSRLWGWPLFTLQKYLTDLSFDRIKNQYLEGTLSAKKNFVFAVATVFYHIHDLIPYGPQIYILARKP